MALYLAAFAAWCAGHGYIGVAHDGIMYAFQAIAHGDLAYLKDDLYLRYGSQDDFTVFSPVYRAFIAAFGFEYGAMTLVIAGQALWAAAALSLFRALFGLDWRALALIAVFIAAVDPVYGVSGALRYGEGFATPRLPAEAFALFALAAAVTRRWIAAGACLAASLAMHPILAVIAAGLALVALGLADRRWFLAVPAGAALGLGGAFADVGPLGRLLESFDPAWLEMVRQRSPHLFTDIWALESLLSRLADVLILATCAVAARGADQGMARRFFIAAAILGIAGFAATWVFADLLHNVFVTQAQPWRAALFTRLFAAAGVGWLILVARRRGNTPLMIVAPGLVCAQVAREFFPLSETVGLVIAACALIALLTGDRREAAARAAGWAAAAVSFAGLLLFTLVEINGYERWGLLYAEAMAELGGAPLETRLLPYAAALIALLFTFVRSPRLSWPVAAAAACLAVFGTATWDARSGWRSFVEASYGQLGEGALSMPEGASVLWQGGEGAPPVWFGMNRQVYLSWPQGAGLVFNRGTAMEYARRSRVVTPVDNRATGNTISGRHKPEPTPDRADMARLCADEAAPTLVVLINPVDGLTGRRWTAPFPDLRVFVDPALLEAGSWRARKLKLVREYHVYDCRDAFG